MPSTNRRVGDGQKSGNRRDEKKRQYGKSEHFALLGQMPALQTNPSRNPRDRKQEDGTTFLH
jgi:hypothetical protein